MERGRQGPKRKRAAAACITCQTKKIKCDGLAPCSSCTSHRTVCAFGEPRRQPRSRKRFDANLPSRVPALIKNSSGTNNDELENRVKRLESLLKGSGAALLSSQSDYRDSGVALTGEQNEWTTLSISPEPERAMRLSNDHGLPSLEEMGGLDLPPEKVPRSQMDDVNVIQGLSPNSQPHEAAPHEPTLDKTGGISCSSPLGRFSPLPFECMQWVIDRSENMNFKKALCAANQNEKPVEFWRSELFNSTLNRRVCANLPSKEETIPIVERFFQNFNPVIPLFSRPSFMELLERQFSPDPCNSVGWWASLNAVIAITLSLQGTETGPASLTNSSRDYMRNCLAVLTELLIGYNDSLAVPALLSTAFLIQGTPDPRPAAALLASAMKLLHHSSLDQKDSSKAERQNRLYWIAHHLENNLRIRSGIPLSQSVDTIGDELPPENPLDQLGIISDPNGPEKINIFRMMAEFAVINTKAYKLLHSAKSLANSDEALMATINELDHKLVTWKERIPIDFQPEYELKLPTEHPMSLHILFVHFAYYNCLQTIHSAALQRHNGVASICTHMSQSATTVTYAARASLRLIRNIPSYASGALWQLVHFPANAFASLTLSIVQNPNSSRAQSDHRLLASFITFLSKQRQADSNELKHIVTACSILERTVADAIERVEKKKVNRKRLQEGEASRPWSEDIGSNQMTPIDATFFIYNEIQPISSRQGRQALSPRLDDSSLRSNLFLDPHSVDMNNFEQGLDFQSSHPGAASLPWDEDIFPNLAGNTTL